MTCTSTVRGLQAVKEMGVFSPLATAGLTKGEVRRWRGTGGICGKKALYALFGYQTSLMERKSVLKFWKKIARGEEYLKQQDFPVVRLRLHGEIVRIEIPVEDFEKFLNRKTDVTAYLKALGFRYITLDMEGFRSGSMDEEKRSMVILPKKHQDTVTRLCYCTNFVNFSKNSCKTKNLWYDNKVISCEAAG